jgi:hypothetical protein
MSLEERELLQRVRGRFEVPKELKPNSILVIGDVHGFTSTYQKFIRRLPQGQRTIQIGDMALGFPGVGLHQMPDEHKFFRGNHDCPEECIVHSNYLGDYGYLPEARIFYLAGAFSIDRAIRTEGVSWWRDEELSYRELDKAVELYKQVKPKFVLSHEAPSKASGVLLSHLMGPYFAAKGECSQSRTAQAMQIMLENHAPEQWVFGHYHVDKQFYTPGFDTKFICVGGMMELGEPPHTYELELT